MEQHHKTSYKWSMWLVKFQATLSDPVAMVNSSIFKLKIIIDN